MTDGDGAQRHGDGRRSTSSPPRRRCPPSSPRPTPSVAGAPVTFDASGSSGRRDDRRATSGTSTATAATRRRGTSPLATRSYPNATVMSIGVRVTDDDGRSAVARMALVVTRPPARPDPAADPGSRLPARPMPGAARRLGRLGRLRRHGRTRRPGGSAGGAGGAAQLDAGLDGASIQTLKLVTRKGLGLRCNADRAATCTVSATLRPPTPGGWGSRVAHEPLRARARHGEAEEGRRRRRDRAPRAPRAAPGSSGLRGSPCSSPAGPSTAPGARSRCDGPSSFAGSPSVQPGAGALGNPSTGIARRFTAVAGAPTVRGGERT